MLCVCSIPNELKTHGPIFHIWAKCWNVCCNIDIFIRLKATWIGLIQLFLKVMKCSSVHSLQCAVNLKYIPVMWLDFCHHALNVLFISVVAWTLYLHQYTFNGQKCRFYTHIEGIIINTLYMFLKRIFWHQKRENMLIFYRMRQKITGSYRVIRILCTSFEKKKAVSLKMSFLKVQISSPWV